MPKVITTATKGLVQSAGAGFKQLDFLNGYTTNLTATANSISVAEGQGGEIGTPSATQIAAATITANALNETAIDGSAGTTTVYLPGATAGTHCALKFTADPANTCLLYTSPSPRDKRQSRMPSSA